MKEDSGVKGLIDRWSSEKQKELDVSVLLKRTINIISRFLEYLDRAETKDIFAEEDIEKEVKNIEEFLKDIKVFAASDSDSNEVDRMVSMFLNVISQSERGGSKGL